MFTGLIEEMGTIRRIRDNLEGKRFEIGAKKVLTGLETGDSIAVDGTCLSVVSISNDSFTTQAVRETINRTTLRFFKAGTTVNLERAMAANSRFDGHFVQGHVDGIAMVSSIEKRGESAVITLEVPPRLDRYIAEKGSIAINGISLTVAEQSGSHISVSVIPLTLQDTTLSSKKRGDYVNIEVDILAKYVERQVSGTVDHDVRLVEKIRRWGYKK
jgi:riboflavin synthase